MNINKNHAFLFYMWFVFYLAGCTCSGGKNRTDSQWTRDMAKQHNVKAQEGTDEGESLMRLSPEGTRARNRSYYPYSGKPKSANEKLINPLPATIKVLSQGAKNYKRYCIYCHGTYGDSKKGAMVAPKMIVQPPSLLSDKIKAYKDGQIYHIIYEGQGLMGSYRIQLETTDQVLTSRYMKGQAYRGSKNIWSVVHYIRALQKASEQKQENK